MVRPPSPIPPSANATRFPPRLIAGDEAGVEGYVAALALREDGRALPPLQPPPDHDRASWRRGEEPEQLVGLDGERVAPVPGQFDVQLVSHGEERRTRVGSPDRDSLRCRSRTGSPR